VRTLLRTVDLLKLHAKFPTPEAGNIYPAIKQIVLHRAQYSQYASTSAWEHAKAGFFGLRKKIPSILSHLDLRRLELDLDDRQ